VSVELKSDILLRGVLDDVDSALNLTLGLCEGRFIEGARKGELLPKSELSFVAGRKIRYINFPDDVIADEQLKHAWLRKKRSLGGRHIIVDRNKRVKIT